MWAKDLSEAGDTGEMGEFAHQWIEIYNNTGSTLSLENVVLHASSADPAIAASADFIKLDRVSNVPNDIDRLGWALEGLGNSGSPEGEGG